MISFKIEYNNIFVSWSKDENVIKLLDYKLIEPYVKLKAKIEKPHYGIDLEKFGVCKNNESEIIYPTIKTDIIESEILYEDPNYNSSF